MKTLLCLFLFGTMVVSLFYGCLYQIDILEKTRVFNQHYYETCELFPDLCVDPVVVVGNDPRVK